MQSIVITGASSGIGKASAQYFAEQGWKVAATMRSPEKETDLTQIENISLYQLDVSDQSSIDKASNAILNDFDTVDVLLNNAGYGLAGPFELVSREQIQRQFNTNVFGLMEVTRAFLPKLREQGSGVILNVSSIGGLVTFPMLSLYHSSKWAVEGYSESLNYELTPFGIQVKIIEPGGVSTDFSGRSLDTALGSEDNPYSETIAKFMQNREAMALGGSTAEQIAEQIYTAATDGKSQLRYLMGDDAHRTYGLRKEQGDDAFHGFIAQQMLG